jgi:hypothetical protein
MEPSQHISKGKQGLRREPLRRRRSSRNLLADNGRALAVLARVADIHECQTEGGVTTVCFIRRSTPRTTSASA